MKRCRGRAAWVLLVVMACTAPAPAAEEFTVVLLPDTQYGSRYQPTWYTAQTQWIRDNAATENVKFVIHLGDVVDQYTSTTQWQNASAAQAILEGDDPIPHSIMPGNHDFTGTGAPNYTRNTTMYNTYFPRSRYSGQSWFGGAYDSTNDNSYHFFSAGGMDFMVMALEPVPRREVVTWADGVIKDHPGHRVIVATHMYLDPEGVRQTTNEYSYFAGLSAQALYDELVYPNPNVFLATCGHICYEALIPSKNTAGNQVYELLTDYQRKFSDTNEQYGGRWMRLLRFVPDENRITVSSFSPAAGDTPDRFDRFDAYALEYDMGGAITPPPARPLATLAHRWQFDGSGADSVGTTNLALSGTTFVSGRFGDGLCLDTDGDCAGYFTNPSLTVTDAFSMAAWVKYDSSNDRLARILNLHENDDNQLNVGFESGDQAASSLVVRILKDNVAYHVVTQESIDRGVFHHVALSFDDLAGPTGARKITIWIDGEKATLSEANHYDGVRGTDYGAGRLYLGPTNDTLVDLLDPHDFPDAFFSGVLDEMRWYHGVLSDEQAAALQYALLPGDANGDGAVDDADAAILAHNWGETGENWTGGDFDGDGAVGAGDASILAANWGTSLGEATSDVPEPGLTALVAAGIAVSLLRRKTKPWTPAAATRLADSLRPPSPVNRSSRRRALLRSSDRDRFVCRVRIRT